MKIKYSYLPFLISLVLLIPIGIKIGISGENLEKVSVLGTSALSLSFSIIFASVLVLALICHFSADSFEVYVINQNIAVIVSSIAMGCAIFAYMTSEVGSYIVRSKTDSFMILFFISGLGTTIALLCYGVAGFFKKNIFEKYSYLVFLPVLWSSLYFIHIQNVTEKKSHLGAFGAVLFVGLLTLSILYQNKILSKFFVNQKTRSNEALFIFSLAGVLCCLFFTVMDITRRVTSGNGIFGSYLKNILDISISLYTISFMLSLKPQTEHKY